MAEETNTTIDPNAISEADLSAGFSSSTTGDTNTPKPTKKVIKLDPPVKNPEGGYQLEQVAIEKPDPGWKYWTIKWGLGAESLEQDFEKFVAFYGKETIMTVFSSQLRFALRGKAKFSIPDEEGEGKTKAEQEANQAEKQAAAMAKFMAEHPDQVILSQKEALDYRPGTKERTSWMGLLQQAKIAMKEGRVEDAKELVRQGNELMMAAFDMDTADEPATT